MRRRKLSPILMYASMNGSHDDASFWLENVNGSHDDASFRLEEQDHKRWNPTKDETDSTALGSDHQQNNQDCASRAVGLSNLSGGSLLWTICNYQRNFTF
mmetsp:Transcript_37506/g.55856  ORF Transcript_37506/g.55856 Transcript_37506/m.55856 type:complete len:100 (-) Transcript_37506:390-689(-)